MLARIRRILSRRSPLELATIIADRLTRAGGFSLISFTPYGTVAPATGASAADIFDNAAKENVWGSGESISGAGSELRMTEQYRSQLIKLLPRFKSMFDAPCGDMNWMRLVLEEVAIDYSGGDISPYVIELNRSRFPHLKFDLFDITADEFPDVDLWHCRDCLFHLSYADIGRAVANFRRSNIPYALITTHRGIIRNQDIPTGGWRYLDLTRPPFNFPKPEMMLKDYLPGHLPRFVGLWSRSSLPDGAGYPVST
jgi:hypothetical protein